MTGQELLDHIRADVLRDVAQPYLWPDGLILMTLAEAEEKFARQTYILLDDRQTITTEVGTPSYAVPTGTIKVMSAAVSTSANDMSDYTRRFVPNNLASSTGQPQLFTNDEASGVIRFYPVPDAVYTVKLRIARLPTAAVTLYTSPETPAQYHLDLAKYVAWQLLSNNDVDGESENSAARHEREWNQRVSDAKREVYRARTNIGANVARSWTYQRGR